MTQVLETITAPALPDLDLEEGEKLGDEILADAVRNDRVQKVRDDLRGGTSSAPRSHTARAWTMGGQVD